MRILFRHILHDSRQDMTGYCQTVPYRITVCRERNNWVRKSTNYFIYWGLFLKVKHNLKYFNRMTIFIIYNLINIYVLQYKVPYCNRISRKRFEKTTLHLNWAFELEMCRCHNGSSMFACSPLLELSEKGYSYHSFVRRSNAETEIGSEGGAAQPASCRSTARSCCQRSVSFFLRAATSLPSLLASNL